MTSEHYSAIWTRSSVPERYLQDGLRKKKSRDHVIVSSGWGRTRRVVPRGEAEARDRDQRIALGVEASTLHRINSVDSLQPAHCGCWKASTYSQIPRRGYTGTEKGM